MLAASSWAKSLRANFCSALVMLSGAASGALTSAALLGAVYLGRPAVDTSAQERADFAELEAEPCFCSTPEAVELPECPEPAPAPPASPEPSGFQSSLAAAAGAAGTVACTATLAQLRVVRRRQEEEAAPQTTREVGTQTEPPGLVARSTTTVPSNVSSQSSVTSAETSPRKRHGRRA